MNFFKRINQKHLIFVVLFFVMIFSFFNLGVLEEGDDLEFHLARIKDLALNIKNMNIPYYFSPYKLEGYGSADVTFYPYATLFVPAFIYLLTNKLLLSFKVWIFIASALTIIFMYISSKEIFKDDHITILSMIVYSLSRIVIFNLHNIYDIAQAIGIASFPLLLAGLYNLYFGDKKKWYYIVIASTFLIESHVISAFFAGVFTIVFSFICIKKIITDKEILKKLIVSTVLIIFLNIGFLYPFIYAYIVDNDFVNVFKLLKTGLGLKSISEIFYMIPILPGEMNIKYFLSGIYNHNALFSIFELLLLSFAIFVIIKRFVFKKQREKNDKIAIAFLIILVYYLVAYTGIWLFIPLTRKIANLQQFNYRILLRGLPFYAMAVAYALSTIKINKKFLYSILIVLLFIDSFSEHMRNIIKFDNDYILDSYDAVGLKRMVLSYSGDMHINRGENSLSESNEDSIMNLYYDYVPFNENTQNYMDGIPVTFNLNIKNQKKGELSYELDYEKIDKDYESYIIFPFYNARGFKAYLDQDKLLYLMKQKHGLVQINTSYFSDSGHITLKYERPIDYIIAFYFSIICYIFLIVYLLFRKFNIIVKSQVKYY